MNLLLICRSLIKVLLFISLIIPPILDITHSVHYHIRINHYIIYYFKRVFNLKDIHPPSSRRSYWFNVQSCFQTFVVLEVWLTINYFLFGFITRDFLKKPILHIVIISTGTKAFSFIVTTCDSVTHITTHSTETHLFLLAVFSGSGNSI